MKSENEMKRIFGDNPISRMNTFEKLTCLKPPASRGLRPGGQPKRQIETSKILTTPEAIVREHRQVMRLRASGPEGPTPRREILVRQPPRIPWYRRIDREVIIECTLWVILILIVICFGISFLFGPLVSRAIGKEIDVSVTASGAYDHATWGSGEAPQPGGSRSDTWVGLNYSGQVKYRGGAFKDWQPTFELEYRREKFDFRTAQAPVQKADPEMWNLMLGVTHDFKIMTAYALGGVSIYNARPSLVEATPRLNHGRKISLTEPIGVFKLGAYRLWEIGPIQVGPEISTEIFTKRPGFSRCREMKSNYIVPQAGVRVQW